MYHPRLKGSHYEMGYHYGDLMYSKGINISQAIQLNDEQLKFARDVLPIYKKYVPELTDEVSGLAKGLRIEFLDMFAWLVTMYGFGDIHGCSCFAFNDNDKTILARNSDMFPDLKKTSESVLYMAQGKNVLVGNSTSFIQLEDGLNEYGLAVGMNFLITKNYSLGINTGFLIRAILENCKNTKEAIDFINSVPLCSTQNIILADSSGNIAVVECSPNKIFVRNSKDYVISTNHFISKEMQNEHANPEQNWYRSVDRYATIQNSIKQKGKDEKFAIKILGGEFGFICQYDKHLNFDTLWSSVYDTTCLKVLRAEGNPSKTDFKEDARLNWGIKKKQII